MNFAIVHPKKRPSKVERVQSNTSPLCLLTVFYSQGNVDESAILFAKKSPPASHRVEMIKRFCIVALLENHD